MKGTGRSPIRCSTIVRNKQCPGVVTRLIGIRASEYIKFFARTLGHIDSGWRVAPGTLSSYTADDVWGATSVADGYAPIRAAVCIKK